MHRLNAIRGLFPSAAVGAGIEMADQAIKHVNDTLRKHHSLTLFTLPHVRLLHDLKMSPVPKIRLELDGV